MNFPKLIVSTLVASIVSVGAVLLFFHSPPSAPAPAPEPEYGSTYQTTVTNPWYFDSTQGARVKIGNSGTQQTQVNFGTCQVLAYSNTITATSTAQVDCSTDGTLTGTITGITASTDVSAHATTTISSTQGGVSVIASYASSTAGFITLRVVNLTGATFTWSNSASTSIRYTTIR